MAVRPVVDGVEREFGAGLKVIRINVQDRAARPLMAEFGFQYTPTFILLDSSGVELWRTVGALDPARVRASLSTNE